MNYTEAIDWLENIPISFDSNYDSYELKLGNITKFLDYLGNPQNELSLIHVGGTNGKGSTCHIISSILQEHGFNVGLFSSPHIYDFRERIKINSNYIDRPFILQFIKHNKSQIIKNNLSFFEVSFAIALCYFKKIRPEYVLIEVGLGGRLDSTNIINPIISVITNIGFDHKKFLGNTLDKIAKEKAGIIKNGIDVIIGEANLKVKKIFDKKAKSLNSNAFYANQSLKKYTTDLSGDYQIKNINTALTTLAKVKCLKLNQNGVLNGIKYVIKNTNLIGRWQIANNKPKVIIDVAHNLNSLEIVFKQIETNKGNIRVVFGTLNKMDQLNCLKIFPQKIKYYFCSPNTNRALNLHVLCKNAEMLGLNYESFDNVKSAYNQALTDSNKNDTILVTGSFYLISDLQDYFFKDI